MPCRTVVLVICTLILSITSSLCAGQVKASVEDQHKITNVFITTFPPSQADGSVKFRLAITGENPPTRAE